MGIPMFYRWISGKCPNAVAPATEEQRNRNYSRSYNASSRSSDRVEIDNLYIDMNNVIHPCFSPEKWPLPESYEEVFKVMFKYIDRLFSLVRPQKLLYMAVDGVAPRAKMNQQRARRFKAAKEASDAASCKEKCADRDAGDGDSRTEVFDSNIITPGTEFMELLSSALQYYVHERMNHDPSWKGIKVIISDASVPGEGEHKIMSYIRLQRNLPGFDPNTRHCLYGLDADLILLGLATHEVHFSILREVRVKGLWKNEKFGFRGNAPLRSQIANLVENQKFEFVHLWVLREFLTESLTIRNQRVKMDPERLIDDFVFMCLFVGNDFLPHLPSLEISRGALSSLMLLYKKEFVNMGGYLIDSCQVNLKRAEHFLKAVSLSENGFFQKQSKEMESRKTGECAAAKLNSNGESCSASPDHVNSNCNLVNPGKVNYKDDYYGKKFGVETEEERLRVQNHAVLKYIEGICWIIHYYFEGVCSWQWFYPYNYAPCASDFSGLEQLEINFTLGKPFKPLDQLMGVLPAASGQALPQFYRKLMIDPASPILDLYPSDFELDVLWNKPAWQAICKLPFIDEHRLLTEIAKVEHTLTEEEKKRNTSRIDKIFVNKMHPLASKISSFANRNKDNPKLKKAKLKRKINPISSGGINGYIYISDNPICPPVIRSPLSGMPNITENQVLSVIFKLPPFHPHIPRPPLGVIMPKKIVRPYKSKGNAMSMPVKRWTFPRPPSTAAQTRPTVDGPDSVVTNSVISDPINHDSEGLPKKSTSKQRKQLRKRNRPEIEASQPPPKGTTSVDDHPLVTEVPSNPKKRHKKDRSRSENL